MIRERNIIAIASNWHFDPTSKHHVMRLLSTHNNVVWVNYHGSRRPQVNAQDVGAIVNKLRQISRGPERIHERMLVITPFLLPLPGAAWARAVNQRLVVRQIRRALAQFPDQPTQLWTFAPDVSYLVGQFAEELDLYYCVDAFSEFSSYDSETIARLEQELMDRSDIVITTAQHLQQAKSAMHPNTHLVTHGVSYDHFAEACSAHTQIPADIAELPGPIFGFFGMIQDWIDLDLISQVARRRPDWTFVMIGKQEVPIDDYRSIKNLHFLGQVPFDTLPGYCKAFDVGLIPFKVNALTVNVNPIKLREYLAAGLPVVSTDLPEVRQYQPDVLIGQSVDQFDAACLQALSGRSEADRARRQSAVRNETWAAKVEQLSTLVGTHLGIQWPTDNHDSTSDLSASNRVASVIVPGH